MKALLIVNPDSGGAVGGRRFEKIARALSRHGIAVDIRAAERRGDARSLASRASAEAFHMVIGGGGDGTIHEIVNGIAGSSLALGILPMGTANVLARELGIPLDPMEACDVLGTGKIRSIDLIKSSEGRYFSCMAGVGFDAQVVEEMDPALKGILGGLAYPLAGLATALHYGLPELSVEIDGNTPPLIGYGVVVCNSHHYGGGFTLCPRARIDDGALDVCVLEKRAIYSIIKLSVAVLMNAPESIDGIGHYSGRTVRITAEPKVPVHMDGDVVGATPVRFDIVPGALRVVAPA
ncbi:MAG: diacylglycerol kinase family lipid kinase [Candidatus Aureabacteria bacterium]|nr:diacylglycerol kinase family lipid kinase [Candidatus Auribacterota bacterium]